MRFRTKPAKSATCQTQCIKILFLFHFNTGLYGKKKIEMLLWQSFLIQFHAKLYQNIGNRGRILCDRNKKKTVVGLTFCHGQRPTLP